MGVYDISGPNTSVSDNRNVSLSSSEKTEIHGEENDIIIWHNWTKLFFLVPDLYS